MHMLKIDWHQHAHMILSIYAIWDFFCLCTSSGAQIHLVGKVRSNCCDYFSRVFDCFIRVHDLFYLSHRARQVKQGISVEYTINYKSYVGKKFCSSLDFNIMYGKLSVLLLTRTKTTFCIYIGTHNGTYSRKNLCGL